jgi:hypothetical protein
LDIDAVEDMADDMAELMEDFNGVFLCICMWLYSVIVVVCSLCSL